MQVTLEGSLADKGPFIGVSQVDQPLSLFFDSEIGFYETFEKTKIKVSCKLEDTLLEFIWDGFEGLLCLCEIFLDVFLVDHLIKGTLRATVNIL